MHMKNNYELMQTFVNDVALKSAAAVDYAAGWIVASRVNTPTKYKGKGRPRKTDYAVYKHPFDQKILVQINY